MDAIGCGIGHWGRMMTVYPEAGLGRGRVERLLPARRRTQRSNLVSSLCPQGAGGASSGARLSPHSKIPVDLVQSGGGDWIGGARREGGCVKRLLIGL